MDIADSFGSLFDGAVADAPLVAAIQPLARENEWDFDVLAGFNTGADLHDEPEPALPTTDGAEEEERTAALLRRAMEGPNRGRQGVTAPPAQPQHHSSLIRQAGFPLCAAGCMVTVSADMPLRNTTEGLAHVVCPAPPGREGLRVARMASQATQQAPVAPAPPFHESAEQKGRRLLAYADAISRGETPEGPNPYEYLLAGQDDNEMQAAASQFLATGGAIQPQAQHTALKTYNPAERQAIIDEGEGTTASNLDRLDITGTHYEALEAQRMASAPADEALMDTFFDGDMSDGLG